MKKIVMLVAFFLTACLPVENPIEISEPTVEIDSDNPSQQETACPHVLPETVLTPPSDFQEAVSFLSSYLNSGGDSHALGESMRSKSVHVEFDFQEIDFARNIEGEILLEIGFFREDDYPQERGWILFYCLEQEYISETVSWTSGPFSGASIFAIHDVNHNENLEVIFKTNSGGGSFCHYGLKIVGFVDGKYTEFIDDPGQVSCPAEYMLSEHDGEVLIKITGPTKKGGLGQGPNRKIEAVFAPVNNVEYALVSKNLFPSSIRIHVLEDAQIAFDNGDVPLAIVHYQNAAFSLELENIPSPYHLLVLSEFEDFEPFAYEYQTAFALFRIISIEAGSGDEEQADKRLATLENKIAEGEAAKRFLVLAKIFLDELNNGSSPEEACDLVTHFIEQEFPELELYIGEWETANIHYKNQTICPFLKSN